MSEISRLKCERSSRRGYVFLSHTRNLKLNIPFFFFFYPSDWYRGHRLRRKSKKVSPGLQFWGSGFAGVQASIQSVRCGYLHNHLFLLQGIFPACYIHLKEATVEGSGWALLQSRCLLPLSWQQNGDKWLLFSLKLFPVLRINLFFFCWNVRPEPLGLSRRNDGRLMWIAISS